MSQQALARPVAVIGLGSMGFGVAQALVRGGFDVVGYDPRPDLMARLTAEGGRAAADPAAAVKGAAAVFCLVLNGQQTEQVLFGTEGCAAHMAPGAVFVSMATLSPDIARDLAARLAATGIDYLDAPISGGSVKAAEGRLSVMGSGPPAAFDRIADMLNAVSQTLFRLGDQPGQGSSFKAVNQLLAGVHIAVASEAMAFAAAQGLDLAEVYRVITLSAGNSWMFGDRMQRVLDNDYRPRSSTDIFVKDLGIVLDVAGARKLPLPIASAALQMFLMTSAAGMGGDDDSSVARFYAGLFGVSDIIGKSDA